MKRIVTIAAAALFLAGMTSPSLAHEMKRTHSHKKPVAAKTVKSTSESPTTATKPVSEPMVKKEAPIAPAPAPTAATAETKPTVPTTPNQPSMAEHATGKTTDMAKDKATEAATGVVKSAVSPTPIVPSTTPTTAAAAKAVANPVPTPAMPTK